MIFFELLMDIHVPEEIYAVRCSAPYPLHSIYSALQHTTTKHNTQYSSYHSRYVYLVLNRNLYSMWQALGTYDSINVASKYGILKEIPVHVNYKELINGRTLLAFDYLDCSRQTSSRIDIKIKYAFGNVIHLHGHDVSILLLYVLRQLKKHIINSKSYIIYKN